MKIRGEIEDIDFQFSTPQMSFLFKSHANTFETNLLIDFS